MGKLTIKRKETRSVTSDYGYGPFTMDGECDDLILLSDGFWYKVNELEVVCGTISDEYGIDKLDTSRLKTSILNNYHLFKEAEC